MLLNVQKRDIKPRLVSLILSAGIILLDQATKLIVTLTVPLGRGVPVIDDFFRIVHVQNPAIAFSLGRGIATPERRPLVSAVVLLVIVLLFLYYLFTREKLTGFQRWTFAALLGGGLGNYVDRIFRPGGVVDFLDFRFYGIFGLQRWPTFNLADATVVVSGILLFVSFLIPSRPKKEAP
jgi:signal peptidase II